MLARAQASSNPKGSLVWAGRAIWSRPDNPDAYLARALGHIAEKNYHNSKTDFALAGNLRPRDYFIWEESGQVRELAGDPLAAIQDFRKASTLAPYYAGASWQLGQALLRNGQEQEAFPLLRQAALRNSALWPGLIDLTWHLKEQDLQTVEGLLKPEGTAALSAFSRFCATHNKPTDALRFFNQEAAPAPALKEGLLQDLMAGKHYTEARILWLKGAGQVYAGDGPIINSSFETHVSFEEHNFGWRPWRAPNVVSVTQDSNDFQSGKQSLRLDYSGEVNNIVLSQLVGVKPSTHYTLSFAAKSRELVTGGLPVITLVDAEAGQPLASSETLPAKNTEWRKYVVPFTTKDTRAITINLERKGCNTSPCPIFGTLWLDSFELR